MLTTWRWCKYKCIYCYRWVKYSIVRQIPLDILKKDLDYLSNIWVKWINLFDDCFLTTNADRLEEIIDLFWNYDFVYRIAIRYEMCNSKTFELLKKMKLGSVQIWLQSVSKETNKLIKRNINEDNFKKILYEFKKRWVLISIDTILWLPWENLKNFIDTYNYALAFMPSRIAVNTLFINPWIWISIKELKNKYWVKLAKRKDDFINNYKVNAILESDNFPKEDMLKAREYIKKTMDKFPFIKIILR
jgi:coproporphyrinogen III oxidase-like Fe-S oxidoreductase